MADSTKSNGMYSTYELLEHVLHHELHVANKSLHIDSLLVNELNAMKAFKTLCLALIDYRHSQEHKDLQRVKDAVIEARYNMNNLFIGYNHQNDLASKLPEFIYEKETCLNERYEAQQIKDQQAEWS